MVSSVFERHALYHVLLNTLYLTGCFVLKGIVTEGNHITQEHMIESMSFEHNRHHHMRACYL